jgi:hypothetical protein
MSSGKIAIKSPDIEYYFLLPGLSSEQKVRWFCDE